MEAKKPEKEKNLLHITWRPQIPCFEEKKFRFGWFVIWITRVNNNKNCWSSTNQPAKQIV